MSRRRRVGRRLPFRRPRHPVPPDLSECQTGVVAGRFITTAKLYLGIGTDEEFEAAARERGLEVVPATPAENRVRSAFLVAVVLVALVLDRLTSFWVAVLAAAVLAVMNGADIVRAHDVQATVDALKVTTAVTEAAE